MSWLPWRSRPTPPPAPVFVSPPLPPAEPEEPEPERLTLLDRFARWRAVFAAQAQGAPSRDEIEAEQARQAAARQAQRDDELAAHLAKWNSHFPGDDFNLERAPGESWTSGGAIWTRLR